MFKLIIVNNKTGLRQESEFETEEECKEHFEKYQKLGFWGREAQKINHPEIVDPVTKEVTPEWTEEISQEYSWEIVPFKKPIDPISPRQIRLALYDLGITESFVDDVINGLPAPDRDIAMIAWKYSTQFERPVPIISIIGRILKLDEDQLDKVWIRGAKK